MVLVRNTIVNNLSFMNFTKEWKLQFTVKHKLMLIERMNPEWKDLYEDII